MRKFLVVINRLELEDQKNILVCKQVVVVDVVILNIVFKVKDGPLIGEINSDAQPNC